MSKKNEPFKAVIWSNMDLDLDDWQECLNDYPEVTDEYEQWELIYEINNSYLEDERENLNIQLGDEILVIGDLGLWNGRRQGYMVISTGNIKDCLYDNACDYCEWYVDNLGDLRFKGAHHDGYNYYLYRVWKDGVTEQQKENLLEKLYYGKATRKDITRVTRRLGDEIAEVYGWDVPYTRKAVA